MAACPIAAAVASEPIVAARKTPCVQSLASHTSGKVVASRPPKRKALIGTPDGSSHAGSYDGHWVTGAVKRELGCAAGSFDAGVQSRPFQSIACAGAGPMPSHHTSPSSVSATLVKMQFARRVSIALGLLSRFVPGATPKKPASGLMARRVPSAAGLIHAMSSPTVDAFHPSKPLGGTIIARLVFPQALGNAPATYVRSPPGVSSPRISMCSASHPSSRAMTEAMRSARHFLPSSALPP